MKRDDDDLGDAESRAENARFRADMERKKSSEPGYGYAPRWMPTGNWRMSWLDLVIVIIGLGILFMVLGMRLFGLIR